MQSSLQKFSSIALGYTLFLIRNSKFCWGPLFLPFWLLQSHFVLNLFLCQTKRQGIEKQCWIWETLASFETIVDIIGTLHNEEGDAEDNGGKERQ